MRPRLTYANVVASLALFVALGGSSYAAIELSKGSVKKKHLAKNAVVSKKVKDGSLLSQDFMPGQLPAGPKGDPGPQGPKGDKGAPGNDAVFNALGRSATDDTCHVDAVDPPNFGGCMSTSLTLDRQSRVLLVASGNWYSFDSATGKANGQCRLAIDGTPVGAVHGFGEIVDASDLDNKHGLAMTAISEPLTAGAHTAEIQCNNGDGDLDYGPLVLSAVQIGAN